MKRPSSAPPSQVPTHDVTYDRCSVTVDGRRALLLDRAYHPSAPGKYDFSGVRDVDKLLGMAQDAGLYVSTRPGPDIHAEADSGGFPGRLMTQKGRSRSATRVSDAGDGNAGGHAGRAGAEPTCGGGV
ncbi:beta-galactosidase [Streptomyces sp. NPDC101776]|uniref:beta-galactosidase n=1 Tax=Streptomyces sp. NPDC101776 TaxID=3366146 RepID=UPI0037F9EC89